MSISVELVHTYAYIHITIYSCTHNSKPQRHVSILVELVHMCAYVHSTCIQTQRYLETPAPCVYVSGASIHACICNTTYIYKHIYTSKLRRHSSMLAEPVHICAYIYTTCIQTQEYLETTAPCVYVSGASIDVRQ